MDKLRRLRVLFTIDLHVSGGWQTFAEIVREI